MSLKESLNLRYNPNSRFEYVVAKHVPDDNPFFLVPIESRKNKVKPKKNPFKEYPPSAYYNLYRSSFTSLSQATKNHQKKRFLNPSAFSLAGFQNAKKTNSTSGLEKASQL